MLRANIYKILLFIWLVMIFTLSLITIKTNSNVSSIPNIDKFVHFCFYFVLEWILLKVLLKELPIFNSFILNAIVSFIICFSIGVLIEWLQSNFTKSRHGDIKDIAFNTFGIVVAILLTYFTGKIRKLISN